MSRTIRIHLGDTPRLVGTLRYDQAALGVTERELDDFTEAFEHPERVAAQQAAGRLRRPRFR